MPKENHTSLLHPDQKLIITNHGLSYTFLGRNAMLMRALIQAMPLYLSPESLIDAIGLQLRRAGCNSDERLAVYRHIGQIRKIVPKAMIYTLSGGRGWRIDSSHHPRIVFDSHPTRVYRA